MRRILPLLALAVVCMSCDAPFDLSLSRAAAVLPKMTFQGTVGPFSDFGGDEQDTTFSFLPEKRSIAPWIDFQNGFLVMRSPTRTALRHVQYSGGYIASGGWDQTYINPAPRYEPFFFEPLKNNNFVSMVGFDPVDTANSSFQIYQGNPGSLDPMLVPNPRNLHSDYIHTPPLNYDGDPLGCSIYPAPGFQPLDDSYWLVRSNIVTLNLREIHLSLDWNNLGASSVLTRPAAPSFPVPELAGVTRCLYYHDPDPVRGPTLDERKSYVSWFDATAGSWRCIRLWGLAAVSYAVVPNITHRIDALLTTGRLLSTEDGVGRLYDGNGDGSLVTQFPLGALRLAGERDVNGIPTVIFSLARIVSENYSRTLSLDLYSIPTADLETLGK